MKLKRIIAILIALIFVISSASLSVGAKEIYNSYTYADTTEAISSPEAVSFLKKFDSSTFNKKIGNITDLCIDDNTKEIYAVDSSNNAIFKFNKYGKIISYINSFDNNGKKDFFNTPCGIFVDTNSNIYIADKENFRIVELDKNGKFVREITAPESTILGENFEFKPTSVVLDSIGRIYVIATGFNQGVLCLDENGEFLNCTGTPKVTFDLIDYFWKKISTDEQKDRMDKYVPTEYNNICIDKEDFLYVTCSAYTIWEYINGKAQTVRKLNAKGTDILKKDNDFSPYGDRVIVKKGSQSGGSILVDSLAMDYGMFSVVDSNRGKVFVYNDQSQLLFQFGVIGDYDGCFKSPSAIEYSDGIFYVADKEKCNISVFKTNSYGQLLIETSRLHKLGDYESEEKVWTEIFSRNNNNVTALKGLANVEYRNGDYKASMKHFKLANDVEGYGKAFKEYRTEMMNKYSTIIVIGIFLVVILLVVVFKAYKRYISSEKYNHNNLIKNLEFGRKLVFRPLSHFWDLTWEGKGTLQVAFIILSVVEVIIFFDAYATGYAFTGKSSILTNPLIVMLKIPITLLLYCICNWCVTSLMDGKAKFKQIWMANCYALIPIIYIIPFAVILSNFIIPSEGAFYNILVGLSYFYVAVLIICANKQIHDYEFGKSIRVLLITILVMAIFIFLAVLFFALLQQMYSFAITIIKELSGML